MPSASPNLADARVWVAGHRGMVGSAVWRALEQDGVGDLVGWSSAELDLTDRDATVTAALEDRPDVVVIAAAKVGGIGANSADPVGFLRDNVRIQTNVMEAAHLAGVDRLLFLGSSCIYPRMAPQPLRPEALMTGALEPTNDGYAIAKIAGIVHVQGYRRQYGRRWISAMPTNLYGPGDDFDLESAHVLPALIHRFDLARREGRESVTLWGSGTPRREFLHVDDLARACVTLLERYDADAPINVGTGEDSRSPTSRRWWRASSATTAGSNGTRRDPTEPRASSSMWGRSPHLAGRRRSSCATGSLRPTTGSSRTRSRERPGGPVIPPGRIVSIAPRYRAGSDPTQNGHYTLYQDDLRAAATRMGLTMVTFVDNRTTPIDGVVPCLDTRDLTSIAASAQTGLRDGDLVMMYEGSLAHTAAFVPVARARSGVTFVINLFTPEPGLVPTGSAARSAHTVPDVVRELIALGPLPPNLVISAETQRRVRLAQDLGIPVAGAWQLHSALWDVPQGSGSSLRGIAPDEHRPDSLRVLIPLGGRGFTREVVHDIAYVVHRLRHSPDVPAIRWSMTGLGSEKFSAQVRGPQLAELGVEWLASPPERAEYAALFSQHDLVWSPDRAFYLSQSSGKALDALVLGIPVVSVEGSWPAEECARWTGCSLTYRDTESAARLFAGLAGRTEPLRSLLGEQQAEIRASYAPEATIRRVLEFACGVDDRPPGRADTPESRAAVVLDGLEDRPRLGPTGVLRSRLVANLAARIGFSPRIRRAAVRRVATLRAVLRRVVDRLHG
jgi:GDP-L-fucose synthase